MTLGGLAAALVLSLGYVRPAVAQDPSIPFNGLILWLANDENATSVTLTGGKVTRWLDAAAGHDAIGTSTTGPRVVSGALNGIPAVRFDGAQQLFSGPLYVNTWTIFVVGKNNNPTENFGLILGPGDDNNNQLRYENGSSVLTYGSSNGMQAVTSPDGDTRVYHALSIRYDGANYQVFRNGVPQNTASFSTNGAWGLGRIGSWYSSCGSCYLQGDIVEVLVYNRALSDFEKGEVDTYLRSRFQLP
jgi:hypothetical protein